MGKKKRTVRQHYSEVGLPKSLGDSVNDFFAEHGIKNVKMGRQRMRVEEPRKQPADDFEDVSGDAG